MADDDDRAKWDARYRALPAGHVAPLEVVADNAHLLPGSGDAADLACGLGGSALFLAARGLRTWAWDVSAVAIEKLARQAVGLPLIAEQRDLLLDPPEAARFDVICVGHFLDRNLCPQISAALRPGGLLFYQTFVHDKVGEGGPANPDYLLGENELLSLFAGLVIRFYREEGSVGDGAQGFRNRVQLIAQRRRT